MGRPYITELSCMSVMMLPTSEKEIEKSSQYKILASRAMNLLFLCHMHSYADNTLEYLRLVSKDDFFHGYDAKVLAYCVTKEVFKENDPDAVADMLSLLIRIVSDSEKKGALILKLKQSKARSQKNTKLLRKIEDFEKFLGKISSPFLD